MQDCIFCRIIRGELPSAKVYESEQVYAFLDIGPIAHGHTLVIPKQHLATLWEVPDELGAELHRAWRLVGQAILQATGASGLNVVMNNYRSAGQVVDHAHWHLIPRTEGDGLIPVVQGQYESNQAMQDMANAIASAVAK